MRWQTWWVWSRKPGLPHLHAKEYSGRAFITQRAALDFVRGQVKAGFIVEVYAEPDAAHKRGVS